MTNNPTKTQSTPQLFDVIVGNPPYVRHELIGQYKEYFEKAYPEVYTGTADLYVYFFAQALKLLTDGGYMGYIVSNKFAKAAYGQKLRKWILENFTLVEYIDHFEEKVFEDAAVDPCIIIIKKAKAPIDHQVLYNKTNLIPQNSLSLDGWSFVSSEISSLKTQIEKNSTKLKDLDVKIYRGILTGFNEAFVVDQSTRDELIKQDPKNASIIKPILRGRDVSRYNIDFAEQYLIVTKNGIDVPIQYPTIAKFFEQKNL